jgi:WD40 repeat protein
VWDLETGRQIRRIAGVANRMGAAVAVSPDGRRALFGVEKSVILWDLETGGEIERFEGHTEGVWHVAFSPDGRRAVSSSLDKTVRVWGLPRGRSPGEDPPVVEVAHLLDGPVDYQKQPWPIGEQAAVSPDGKFVLAGGADAIVRLWDRESGEVVRRLEGHKGRVMCVAFSPDGRRAFSAGEDKIVRAWDLTTGRLAHELRGHTEWVFGLAFSPDGRRAYSCGGGSPGNPWTSGTDLAVRVWDLERGREERRLEGHTALVWSVAASPDGRYVLSGGFDTTPILWDAATGAEVRRFRGHTDKVLCVAFLPGGRRAVTSGVDKTIRVWDVETGGEFACLRGHPDQVTWVAASPDGRRLLSSDFNGRELRLWDVETRALIHRFGWGEIRPTRGSFTPDGRHAAWPGGDGVVRLYRLPPPAAARPPTRAADSARAGHLAEPRSLGTSIPRHWPFSIRPDLISTRDERGVPVRFAPGVRESDGVGMRPACLVGASRSRSVSNDAMSPGPFPRRGSIHGPAILADPGYHAAGAAGAPIRSRPGRRRTPGARRHAGLSARLSPPRQADRADAAG